MPVIDSESAVRHHRWQNELDASPNEMQICQHCGGIGQVPRVTLGWTVAWIMACCLVMGALVGGAIRVVEAIVG